MGLVRLRALALARWEEMRRPRQSSLWTYAAMAVDGIETHSMEYATYVVVCT